MIGESRNASELIQSYIGGQRNFRNANLSGLELKRAHLPEIDLQGAYLRWADFQGANLKLANLSWADLQKANLSDANLQKAMLKEANLRKANLQWADLQEAQLQGANLFQSHLMCANFRGARLRLANLEAADLDKAELSGADLRVAKLVSALLRNADLKQAKLQGANLQYVNLTGANLEGVNLQGADLTGAKLFGANIQNGNLQHTNLEGVDFTEAKLFGANLQGANLERTLLPSLENMQGASLKEAKLLSIILPKGENLEKAILPNGSISAPTNILQSLPQSTQTDPQALATLARDSEEPTNTKLNEPQDLVPFVPDDEEATNAEISEPVTDLVSNRAVNSLSEKSASRLDPTPSTPRVNAGPEEFLELIEQRMGSDGHFTSVSLAISKRRGPDKLRKKLLEAYQGRCSITGCDTEAILEVAFLQPNQPDRKSEPSNGLLMRADIHTLFDLHLIAIEPETLKILVAPSLRNSNYGSLHGQLLRQTSSAAFKPDRDSLQLRLQWCSWLNASA